MNDSMVITKILNMVQLLLCYLGESCAAVCIALLARGG
jgi:hypothetical protein